MIHLDQDNKKTINKHFAIAISILLIFLRYPILSSMNDATGFVSPAKSYEEKGFDYNKLLITNPSATFTMRAITDKLLYKGILPNALLIVDRAVKPKSGDIVVYAELGEFRCREIYIQGNKKIFIDESGTEIPRKSEIIYYGVVTKSINVYDFSC